MVKMTRNRKEEIVWVPGQASSVEFIRAVLSIWFAQG